MWGKTTGGTPEPGNIVDSGGFLSGYPSGQPTFTRRDFLGLDVVDAPSLDEVFDRLLARQWRDEPERLPIVVTPNVDIVVQLEAIGPHPLRRQFVQGWCVLPDGQPLIMLSRLCGVPLQARLCGSTLIERLWPRLAADGEPLVAFAGNENVAQGLRARHPDAEVIVPPEFSDEEDGEVRAFAEKALERLDCERIDFVTVGIGFPASSLLVDCLLESWPSGSGQPVFLGVGGAFEMYLGMKRRAPALVQEIGMEWFFRFVQEPRRLYRRYFLRDPRFLVIGYREWSRLRRAV
ncbi:MAG: WecB/TagA/CpsF family glycosyltransferase [Acidimicrobiales bacterium]